MVTPKNKTLYDWKKAAEQIITYKKNIGEFFRCPHLMPDNKPGVNIDSDPCMYCAHPTCPKHVHPIM